MKPQVNQTFYPHNDSAENYDRARRNRTRFSQWDKEHQFLWLYILNTVENMMIKEVWDW